MFSHFEKKRALALILFNGEITKMILPTKVCINFHI